MQPLRLCCRRTRFAVVAFGDRGREPPGGDLGHGPGCHVQRRDHLVEGTVEALHDPAEVPPVARHVGAGRESPGRAGLGQPVRIRHQPAQRCQAVVQVVPDQREVARVVRHDERRHVSPGQHLDRLRHPVERSRHRVQRLVHPLDDRAEGARVAGGVGAKLEPALHRRLRERPGVGRERAQGRDAGVERFLDGVEAPLELVAGRGGEVPSADPGHGLCGNADGTLETVDRLVPGLEDGPEFRRHRGGVGADLELPGRNRVPQPPRFIPQRPGGAPEPRGEHRDPGPQDRDGDRIHEYPSSWLSSHPWFQAG